MRGATAALPASAWLIRPGCGLAVWVQNNVEMTWTTGTLPDGVELPPWLEAAQNHLAEHGPATAAALAEALGLEPDDVQDSLELTPQVYEARAGWVNLLALWEGAVFTHRLQADEIEQNHLETANDLELFQLLVELNPLPAAGGGNVALAWLDALPCEGCGEVHDEGDPVLHLPKGWLGGRRPGELIGLRYRDGKLALEPADPESLGGERSDSDSVIKGFAAEARDAFETFVQAYETEGDWPSGEYPGIWVIPTLVELRLREPDLFDKPLPPLSELLDDRSLEAYDDGMLGLPGLPAEPHERSLEELVRDVAVLGALRTQDDSQAHSIASAAASDDELLLRASEEVERYGLGAGFADALQAAAAAGDALAAARLLAARAAEHDGRPTEAYDLLVQAAAANLTLPLVWRAAAEFVAVAGTGSTVGTPGARRDGAAAADRLLQRAGDDQGRPMRKALRPLLAPPIGTQSRNSPCACGSGRKYKACCLGNELHALPARAGLIHHLLGHFAARGTRLARLISMMIAAGPGHLASCQDLAIFESGGAEEYLTQRGHWLLEDERELLATWCAAPLALYEVVSTGPGHNVTLRPLPRGESVIVADLEMASTVKRLDLFLCRPLWDGKDYRLFSRPFPVPRRRRVALLGLLERSPAAAEIAAFFGPQPLPALVTREGDELVECEAVYEIPAGALDLGALPEGWAYDGGDIVISREDGPDRTQVLGMVRHRRGRWALETHSIERLRPIQAQLLALAPQARLISESTVPMARRMAEGSDIPAGLPGPPPPGSEASAVLEEFTRRYEEEWVDDSIPALGGRTPRECVAEGGEALDELMALLDDFEAQEVGDGAMKAARLRDLLGLP